MHNNSNQDILNELNQNTADLLQSISLFNQEQFNKIPFKDSWTAGQVAEHIFKSESAIPGLLTGNNKPTLRQPDQFVPQIKNIFLDFSTALKSPEFILPSNEKKDKLDFYNRLKTNREIITKLATQLDLSKTYDSFPFPGFDEMTGIEWLTFIVCHAKRHNNQLQNIFSALV